MVILDIPPRLITPKNRSSAVPPAKFPSLIFTGPITPREPPKASNASNCVDAVVLPSVHTKPTCVGRDPRAAWSNTNVYPRLSVPKLWVSQPDHPFWPEPSIAPSSPSTESPTDPDGQAPNVVPGVFDIAV